MNKGDRIKKVRTDAGLSQVELSGKLGISKQLLYKYESGKVTNIPSDKVEMIASICGTTPEYIMGWEDVSDVFINEESKHNFITSKRIKDALHFNDMKAVDLAAATGINKASISQYVNGSHAPSKESAEKIASVLHVSPIWLMGFDVPIGTDNVSEVRKALLDFVQTLSEDQCQVVLQMLQSFLGKS